ncbi:hypothetical protein DPQ25_00910 [Hydrogeniiclostridium mannosilyticum]|uniref:Conjugal transfer protein n=1 Tax=Hydrogeniiclostridium mannosilyticum TaxID=2764322 RepID=A0A328UGB6_9FIRM|nr:hypothetical protein DPQ25_00910 [Hydrogeniiclostridium mannosilyticum]
MLCPVCGNKTRNRIREDTVLKNYPLYCPKCKQETLIEAENLKVTVLCRHPEGWRLRPFQYGAHCAGDIAVTPIFVRIKNPRR